TWTQKGVADTYYGMAMSSNGQYQTISANSGYTYVSSNYGATWVTINTNTVESSVLMSSNGQYQTLVPTSGGYINVSSDYGATWVAVNTSAGNNLEYFGAMSADGIVQTAVVYGGYIYVISYYGIVTQGGNGNISPGNTNISSGGSQLFTITPTNGYNIQNVIVDGVNQGSIPFYTFPNVTSNHTITASYTSNNLFFTFG
ncbi:MAG: hypothetical protein HQK94_17930, partial [Nitrospirae bacterium]|nr:hypothetical protein [Nitrospirota bacterium]